MNHHPTPGGLQQTAVADESSIPYAGLGVCGIAFLLDLVFLGFLIGLIEIIVFGEALPAIGILNINGRLIAMFFAVFVLYFGYTESSPSQASLGKMMMDLKVVNSRGGRISFFTSVYRYLLTLASTISLGYGFIPALKNRRKASWHDKLSKSYVVKAFRDREEF